MKGKREAQDGGILSLLEERGLLSNVAGPRDGLELLLSSQTIGAYCGIDPTAPSLHIGNLSPLMVLFWLYLHGHHTFTLLGGGTVQIGDPSWRIAARNQKSLSEHRANLKSIQQQMQSLWERVDHFADHSVDPNFAKHRKRGQLDNADWLQNLRFMEIMGSVGRALKVSELLAKDSMKSRLWTRQNAAGEICLTLSELTYSSMQSWDFWHVYETYGVQLQVGGGDQYGNITTSVDAVQYMIRAHRGDEFGRDERHRSYGMTTPLITIGKGPKAMKMGKSSGNAVWLCPKLTSDFDMYQWFMRLPDNEVEKFWKMYTFTSLRDIEQAMTQHYDRPEQRTAHHGLAYDFLKLHRGVEAAESASKDHRMLFSSRQKQGRISVSQSMLRRDPPISAPDSEVQEIGTGKGKPSSHLHLLRGLQATPYPAALVFERTIADILVDLDICRSKSEVNQMLSGQGGLYYGLDFETIKSPNLRFRSCHPCASREIASTTVPLMEGNLLILRRGKWKIKLVRVVSNEEYHAMGEEKWSRAWRASHSTYLNEHENVPINTHLALQR